MPNSLERSLSNYTEDRPKKPNQISGLLGISPTVVQVPNRNGYVYVRLRNNTSELIQAWNENVSAFYDMPVLVEWNGHRYVVSGRDTERYAPAGVGWGSESPFLPMHGSQHSFAPELGYGGDVTWIYSRQIMPIATSPSGTNGSPVVWVQPHVYRNPVTASWNYVGDDVSPNLLPAKPTGTFGRMVLLVWNTDTSSVLVITGSYHSPGLTGTIDILPYIPTVTNPSYVPLSAIRMVSGTMGIGWDNIYDVRQFVHPILNTERVSSYWNVGEDTIANTVNLDPLTIDTELYDPSSLTSVASNIITVSESGFYEFYIVIYAYSTTFTAFNGNININVDLGGNSTTINAGYTTAMGISDTYWYIGPVTRRFTTAGKTLKVQATNNLGSGITIFVAEFTIKRLGNA